MVEQALFLGCSLVVFGMIIAIIGIIQLRIPLESLQWPSVDGTIIDTATASNPSDATLPAIRYQYSVRGKSYSGSRISFSDHSQFHLSNRAITNQQYSPGTSVKVYYDASRPDRSVLIPGAGLSSYVLIALGGLLFVVGLIAGLFSMV